MNPELSTFRLLVIQEFVQLTWRIFSTQIFGEFILTTLSNLKISNQTLSKNTQKEQ